MGKKLIRLTESDLHRIVKESIGKILKEGYYEDLYLDDNDDSELRCPYCESDNVQEVRGKDGSWDGSCRCYDCGKVFDIDSARGNNYFEPDWDAMRHESHKRNGKVLKEMDSSVYRVMRVVSVEPNTDKPSYYGKYKIGITFDDKPDGHIRYQYTDVMHKVGQRFKQEFDAEI